MVFAPAPSIERTFSGRFSATAPIAVSNLTVADGEYRVHYGMRILVQPQAGRAIGLRCGVVDTSGRIEFFDALAREVPAGRWVTIDAEGVFELPELTLGIRCVPDRPAPLVVVVRDARLEATAP